MDDREKADGLCANARLVPEPEQDLLLDPRPQGGEPPVTLASLDEHQERILGFQREHSATAVPFDWTFTRTDLHTLLDRLDQRGRLAPAA